jgi:hypothetical protein
MRFGYNALVLETNDPREFTALFSELHTNLDVNAAFDGWKRDSEAVHGRRSSNICSCLASTSWPNEPRSQLLKHLHAPSRRIHTHASCRMTARPQLVEWMADRLKRRHTSREDRIRAHVAIVKR